MYKIVIILTMLLTIISGQSIAKPLIMAVSVSPLSAPIVIANEFNYFKQQGLDIHLEPYISGKRSAEALLAGKADFATSSEAVIMFKSFQHDNFSVVATFVESDNDVKILAHRQSKIVSVKDLSQHRVGTIIGTSAHFFIDHSLLMNGIDPNSVEIVPIKPEQTAESLKSSKVDAVASWEPHIYLAQETLGEDAIIVSHDKLYTETFNLLMNRQFAKNNISIVKKVLLALQKAIEYINNEPEKTQQIIAKRFKKEPGVIQSTWKDYHFELSLHQSLISSIETEARWAVKRNFVKHQVIPNYLKFIFTEPLRSINQDAVSIFQ